MSALDGFYSTWNKARETFGQGTPDDGSQFDGSSRLMEMKASVDAAAPDDRWQGSGSQAYAAANKEHASVYEKLAELDKKMAGEVKKAADVVTVGRTNLDTSKGWVESMVNSLPTGLSATDRENKLIPIAREGITKVDNIVTSATTDMTTIKGNVDKLKSEYETVQKTMRFGPDSDKEGDKEADALGSKEGEDEEKDVHEQAEQDVQDALGGDKEAAGRVEQVLDQITPGQKLDEKQGAYLSQMQAQQKGMTLERLKEVEGLLGDHGDILVDSWQLMSNKDVEFPTTETTPEKLDDPNNVSNGGLDKLPDSVKNVLESSGAKFTGEAQTIANMVSNGDERLQKGTELDRALIGKADAIMDTGVWEADKRSLGDEKMGYDPFFDPAVSDIFSAVGRDHEIVYDHLASEEGQDFLHDINHHAWGDKGESAGSLFEWTKNASGPEAELAADTANIYGRYIGEHGNELLDLPGEKSLGDVNPQLVQAYGAGLQPYQEEMVGENYDPNKGFQPIDNLEGNMDNTKRLFAVIDSDPTAAEAFNKSAYRHALDFQDSFAELASRDPNLITTDERLDDLQSSARLLGAINGGAQLETTAHIDNTREAAFQAAKDSYEFRKNVLETVLGNVPHGGRVSPLADDFLLGPEPTIDDIKVDEAGLYTNTGISATETQVQRVVANAQYEFASRLAPAWDPHFAPQFLNDDGKLKGPTEIDSSQRTLYNAQLLSYTSKFGTVDSFIGTFRDDFMRINGLDPKN
ncbi:EspA/EspE family type VII secretion system effector [Mycobacterium sp. LTG2003]